MRSTLAVLAAAAFATALMPGPSLPDASASERVAGHVLTLTGPPREGIDPVVAALGVRGVTDAVAVEVGEVGEGGGGRSFVWAAADAREYRPLAPEPTRRSDGVWEALADGEALAGHAADREALGGWLGDDIALGDGVVRLGAHAAIASPSFADVLIDTTTADAAGLAGQRRVLVGFDMSYAAEAAAHRLRAVTGMDAHVVARHQQRLRFQTVEETASRFEPFTYTARTAGPVPGIVDIDPAWIRRNIVWFDVEGLNGQARCHRLVRTQMQEAFQEVADAGLMHLIDPADYGGCFVPRHIMFNPSRPLSTHAWGIAFDVNVATNGYGAVPQLDLRVVEIFERWGFSWGGWWSVPDGMHFELARLLEGVE